MDDAYDLLVKNKHKGESFSSVIRRIADKKENIMKFAGAWKDMTDEEADKIKDTIQELREKSTRDLIKKLKDDSY